MRASRSYDVKVNKSSFVEVGDAATCGEAERGPGCPHWARTVGQPMRDRYVNLDNDRACGHWGEMAGQSRPVAGQNVSLPWASYWSLPASRRTPCAAQ